MKDNSCISSKNILWLSIECKQERNRLNNIHRVVIRPRCSNMMLTRHRQMNTALKCCQSWSCTYLEALFSSQRNARASNYLSIVARLEYSGTEELHWPLQDVVYHCTLASLSWWVNVKASSMPYLRMHCKVSRDGIPSGEPSCVWYFNTGRSYWFDQMNVH